MSGHEQRAQPSASDYAQDGIRAWIDYGGHEPQAYYGMEAEGWGRVSAFLTNCITPEYRCAICAQPWPCSIALRRERDGAEAEGTRRGDMLRALGIDVTRGAKPSHPDIATPKGRAFLACRDEILRRRAEAAARIATQQVNLVAWHPTCNHQCSARNHAEFLLINSECDERAYQAWLIADTIRIAYGVEYQSHEPIAAHQQADARREYEARAFASVVDSAGVKPDTEGGAGTTAYVVRFLSGAPLDTLRAFVAEREAIEAGR